MAITELTELEGKAEMLGSVKGFRWELGHLVLLDVKALDEVYRILDALAVGTMTAVRPEVRNGAAVAPKPPPPPASKPSTKTRDVASPTGKTAPDGPCCPAWIEKDGKYISCAAQSGHQGDHDYLRVTGSVLIAGKAVADTKEAIAKAAEKPAEQKAEASSPPGAKADLPKEIIEAQRPIDVLFFLQEKGFKEWKTMLAEAKRIRPEVTVLSRINESEFDTRMLRLMAGKLEMAVEGAEGG